MSPSGPVVVGLVLSSVALLTSLGLLLLSLQGGHLEEVEERLADLEAEHDYLMAEDWEEGEEVEVDRRVVCSLRPDPGPCRGEVRRWYYLPR